MRDLQRALLSDFKKEESRQDKVYIEFEMHLHKYTNTNT